jgi:tetratricopeptide (TPR) repeat protein
MTKPIVFLLIAIFSFGQVSFSQDVAVLLTEAKQAESQFKDADALAKYQQILKVQPNHITALCRSSELLNVLGRRQAAKEKQREYYTKSLQHAQRAIKVAPTNSEANFVMSLAMGRLAQTGGGEQRINAVREIKSYAEKCIQYDPNNYKGYHVLGKWHFEVSSLNSVERWLVKVTYGGLPKASVEEAIKLYEKSMRLNPGFLLNYLELAKAWKEKDQPQKSISLINKMLPMPSMVTDDNKIKEEARKLLKELE